MTDPCWRKADLMTATIHHLPARQPEAAPDPETSAFLSVMYDAAVEERMRRAYEAMGIRQPPRSRSAVPAFTGPAS